MSDEETNIPKPKYHLGDHFSSAYFGSSPSESMGVRNPDQDHKIIANFISLLTDPAHRDKKHDALVILRNNKAQQFLVDLIGMKEYKKYRRELLMACWESGLDFSAHLIFFANVVATGEYLEALEAITIIDDMQNIADPLQRNRAVEILSDPSLDPGKQPLTEETITRLRNIAI